MTINIILLEDKKKDYEQLYSILFEWANTNETIINISWCQTGDQLTQILSKQPCDILFSDIELLDPNGTHSSGVDVCKTIRQKDYHGDIIFLTAFREYVFDGYDVQAFQYLLKPIEKEKIFCCMDKYKTIHQKDYYYLHKGADILQISYNDIIAIKRAGHDIEFQTLQGIHTERTSLTNISFHLPKQFIRCHKSCIVNAYHIQSLVGSTLYLTNKKTQMVGRNYLEDVRKRIVKMYFE